MPCGHSVMLREACNRSRKGLTQPIEKKYRLDEIGDSKPGRAKHLSAVQIKYILGEAEFNRCFKFTLVRNPWARMVSRYCYTHVEAEPSLLEKLRRGTTRNFHDLDFDAWLGKRWKYHQSGKPATSQLEKITDLEGHLLVDHVGRLESVQDTVDRVSREVSISRLEMPHKNRTQQGHYAQHYNQHTRDMVAEICRQDIEYFGYQFEE